MKLKDLNDWNLSVTDDNIYGRIDESGAGIKRVIKQLGSKDFIIISASRGSNSKKENKSRHNQLIKTIRSSFEGGSKSFGAYQLVGSWKECTKKLEDGQKISDCKSIGGEITNALELSWAIPKPNDVATDDFFKIGQVLAKKYNQDAFIAKVDGKMGLFGKDGSKWESWGNVSQASVTKGFEKLVDLQGFSSLKKDRSRGKVRNIIFEDLNVMIPEDSNYSKQLFEAAHILNPLLDDE